jgi:hypothetical protein
MLGEHAGGEDQDSPLAADGPADEVGSAEYEQWRDRGAEEALEVFSLGVGLAEHSRVDVLDVDSAAMRFRLDGDDAAGSDDDVVDVAAAGVDVVDRVPPGVAKSVKDESNVLLASRTAVPPLDDRQPEPIDQEQSGDDGCLGSDERPAPVASDEADEQAANYQSGDAGQRAPSQPAGGATCVPAGSYLHHRSIGDVSVGLEWSGREAMRRFVLDVDRPPGCRYARVY